MITALRTSSAAASALDARVASTSEPGADPPQPPLAKGGRVKGVAASLGSPPWQGGVRGGLLAPGLGATHRETT